MRMWALVRLWMALTLILLVMAQSRWKYHAYAVAAERHNLWMAGNANSMKINITSDCNAFDICNLNETKKQTGDEKNIQIFMCTNKLHAAYE